MKICPLLFQWNHPFLVYIVILPQSYRIVNKKLPPEFF
nr:MAG TPA: PLASMINOGEN ACTIVATOR INHIBITOR-1, HYDROLASE INHIBITOR.7A [Caudoviricetes sp.]